MAAPTDILKQIEPMLPTDREVRTVDLRTLFEGDAEAVYGLAVHGLPEHASTAARGLERLSRTLSILMRDGFIVESTANQQYARGHRGGILPLDDGKPDLEFLQRLYTGSGYSSKMDAQKRSRDSLAFFLDEHSWDAEVRSTLVLRLAPQDAQATLGGLPRYQYASLLDCAREVVRCPTVVYKGLRHDGPMKTEGLAFCGIPSRRHTNSGASVDVPPGFIFVVFANQNGYVFDWDWISASSEDPRLPRNAEERFPHGKPIRGTHGELLLGNVRGKPVEPFRPKQAWFSAQGDCVFWYHSDAESYAERYDEYLTVFFNAQNLASRNRKKDECVGFKLKMVSRLYETVRRWARPGTDECIQVEVEIDQDRIEVELSFLMKAWAVAALPHTQELLPGMRLMERLGAQGVRALNEKTPIEFSRRSLEELRTLQPV